MKYAIAVWVALILLSGCSSKPVVTIEMQNYTHSNWILVSVRDTSIVILPLYEEIGKGIAFTHCVVIPSRAISRVILHPRSDFLSSLPLALFGAGIGLALKACNCDDRLYHIVLGLVIGFNLSKINALIESLRTDAYFLWLGRDRDRLRQSAVFPIEPEIMKYVK